MKFWKKWPYWLRGGIIGGGIALVCIFVFYLCAWNVFGDAGYRCAYFLVFQIFPITWISNFLGPLWEIYYQSVLGGVVVWFFIGSLVGAFIDFIKKRKSPTV